MKRAIAVIGACLGDEGKGLMTDYFCRQSAEIPTVVRFNGGAQAGHTVVTPQGKRHVFHHYGAGTLAGAQTYLSEYFLVNPDAWIDEYFELIALIGKAPTLYIHPDAPVTTVYDMFVNQKIEESRQGSRHGSCGMGVHETMMRHPALRLTFGDLYKPDFKERIDRVRHFALSRLLLEGIDAPEISAWLLSNEVYMTFLHNVHLLKEHAIICHSYPTEDIIFEGAQGLLLDAENKQFFPHVTHSRTGLTNVIDLAQKMELEHIDVFYVARNYLTRHGYGPLPGEDQKLWYEDNTNNTNPWQGRLRFAPQDWKLVDDAIRDDFNDNAGRGISLGLGMAITHLDQCPVLSDDYLRLKIMVDYESYGPTANDISETRNESSRLWRAQF